MRAVSTYGPLIAIVSHNQRPADMLPRFLYPFLRYRGALEQLGPPFLLLCAIALPCWYLVRRYRLRTSGQPRSSRRELLLLTFVVYLLGLATVTLAPAHASNARRAQLHSEPTAGIELQPNLASLTCSSESRASVSHNRAFCMDNAAGNVLLFLPLGFVLPLVFKRLRTWQAVLIAIALSSSIELAQYFTRAWGSNRSADVNDVILNVLGACLGLALVSLLRWRQPIRLAA
jgi:glycopeptide antibiotics resistance protein